MFSAFQGPGLLIKWEVDRGDDPLRVSEHPVFVLTCKCVLSTQLWVGPYQDQEKRQNPVPWKEESMPPARGRGGRWGSWAGSPSPTPVTPSSSRKSGSTKHRWRPSRLGQSLVWKLRPREGEGLAKDYTARGWHCAASLILQRWTPRPRLW